MYKKNLAALLAYLILATSATTSYALSEANDQFKYPFFLGVTGGYGWTTWNGLVPSEENQSIALSMSTPQNVSEGGALWGVFAGYEFMPSFALEFAYTRYPNAKVTFDPDSLFTFEHNGLTEFTTRTEMVSLMAKIMLIIPRTTIRAYSGIGVGELHRSDVITDQWVTSPTFGAGFNYNFTPHIMGELGANFTVGRGESELSPAEDYFPFLYSAFLRLAYRF